MIDVYEKFEKHDALNPLLFDEDNHLLPDVRNALLAIANKFLEGLAEDEIKINVKDIKIVGSNCSYNYTDKSDIDLHIEADTKSLACPYDLYPLLYSAYRSIFNDKYDFSIKGIPVEIFVETSDTEQMSEALMKENHIVSNLNENVSRDNPFLEKGIRLWLENPKAEHLIVSYRPSIAGGKENEVNRVFDNDADFNKFSDILTKQCKEKYGSKINISALHDFSLLKDYPQYDKIKAEIESEKQGSTDEKPVQEEPIQKDTSKEDVSSTKNASRDVARLNRQRANNKKIITAFKKANLPIDSLTVTKQDKNGKQYTASSKQLGIVRKELFGESVHDDWTLVKEDSNGESFWDGKSFTIPFADRDKASYCFNSAEEAREFIKKNWPWEEYKNKDYMISPYLKGNVKINGAEVPETEYHLIEARQQTALRSNGIYSVMNDTWIKEPVPEDIPELDSDKFEALYSEWEDKYFDIIEQNSADAIDDFIEDLYDLRKASIAEEGEYGYGNQVFKEMRNLGYLDNLKEVKNQLISRELSLESLQEDAELDIATPYMLRNDGALFECGSRHPYLINLAEESDQLLKLYSEKDFFKVYSLDWFRNKTQNEQLKEYIDIIQNYFNIEQKDVYKCKSNDEALGFLEMANDEANQEFLRLRMSSLLYGGSSKDLYARISSIDFNWYGVLFDLLSKKKTVQSITITKDGNTFGGRFEYYKIGSLDANHMDRETFLTLPGTPVVETFSYQIPAIEIAAHDLKKGRFITESYPGLTPWNIHKFYERQIREGLRYNIGNTLKVLTQSE